MNRQKLIELHESLQKSRLLLETDVKKFTETRTALATKELAHATIAASALAVQRVVHQKISQLVTRCLAYVFDDPYTFEIRFVEKRGTTEAQIVFTRDGVDCDPLTASGGGVVDVAAFGLRLACLMLTRPAPRRLLVLDEPFRFVSVEYRWRVTQLLRSLCEEFGIQIVMVTHMDELRLGSVVDLKKEI